MNRTQKKCLIASAGLHLLLLMILIVGPAFLLSRNAPENLPVLDFIPAKTIDANAVGGGTPAAKPPAPAPPVSQPPAQPPQQVIAPAPQPKPQPVKISEPEPPKNLKPNPEAFEPAKPPKHKIEINKQLVTRSQRERNSARLAAERKARQAAEAEQRRLAAAIGRATSEIKTGLAPSTTVEFNGPGGGGPSYGNWKAAVQAVYTQAADTIPNGVTDKNASVVVTVTIARDGAVMVAHITEPCENAAVNRAVQDMLDRVKIAVPLPDDTNDQQRTISFTVTVVAKLLG